MSKKNYTVDMVNGPMLKSIISFVIPLILSNVFQLLYNAADMIVVSRFAGSEAMASVGATGPLNTLIVGLFIGFADGASVVVSKKFGANDEKGIYKAVHTAILLGIIAGVATMAGGIFFSKPLLGLLGTPAGRVMDGANLYMKILYCAMPFAFVFNFGASILRAMGNTKTPLYILSVSGIINVVLNLVFVVCFHLDVAGVGLATLISNIYSASAMIYILCKGAGPSKLFLNKLRFFKDELLETLKLGIPAGLQGSFFGISNMLVQTGINSFGVAAIAGCSASGNIESILNTVAIAFGMAAMTGVGQNYGAKNEKGIYNAFKTGLVCVAVAVFVLGAIFAMFSKTLIGLYINDSDVAVNYGALRLCILGLSYFLCGIQEVQFCVLRGLGYSSLPMINSFGMCLARVLWISMVLPAHHSQEVLYMSWPVSWVFVIMLNIICYMSVKKKVIRKMYV